jgi:hypothetical protein
MLYFTDYCPNQHFKYYIGWSIIAVVTIYYAYQQLLFQAFIFKRVYLYLKYAYRWIASKAYHSFKFIRIWNEKKMKPLNPIQDQDTPSISVVSAPPEPSMASELNLSNL